MLLYALGLLWLSHAAATTVYLCGDSTMADPVTKGTPKELARVGWGAAFAARMTAKVVNLAQIGASVRSFTNAGLFDQIIQEITVDDWMICQFGHNELGSHHTSDKAALPGIGPETEDLVNTAGKQETVRTFGGYLSAAVTQAQAKGAHAMILSQTPEVAYSALAVTPVAPNRFVQWAHDLADSIPDVGYYDHYQAFADYLVLCGARKSASFFLDNRHMNKLGARHAAELFIQWLRESDSDLRHYIDGDIGGSAFANMKRSRHVSYTSHRGHKKRRLSQY